MAYKLVGQELYQIPTNADLGSLAYQNSDGVNVGLINVANTASISGAIAGLTVGQSQSATGNLLYFTQVPSNTAIGQSIQGTNIAANTTVSNFVSGFATYQPTFTATTASTVVALTATYGLSTGFGVAGQGLTYGTTITSISNTGVPVTYAATSSTTALTAIWVGTTTNIAVNSYVFGTGVTTGTLVTSIVSNTLVNISNPATITSGQAVVFAPTVSLSVAISANTLTQNILFYPTITLNQNSSAAVTQNTVATIYINPVNAGAAALTIQNGGLGVNGNSYFSSPVQITSTLASGSTSTGALVVQGGMGVNGQLYSNSFVNPVVSGVQYALNNGGSYWGALGTLLYGGAGLQQWFLGWGPSTGQPTGTSLVWTNSGTVLITATNVWTVASSTNTGALVVAGGVGIGGSLYVGGNLNVAGTISATISGVITTATNIAGGTTGQIPYQTNPGATSFFGPGSAGQVLVSNGAAAPAYQSTLTLAGTTAGGSTNSGALQVVGGVGIGGTAAVGGTVVGAVNGTNGTAFLASNGAYNNIALGMQVSSGPANMAIRDLSTVSSIMYFDSSANSATGGSFQWRATSGYTQLMNLTTSSLSINVPTTFNSNVTFSGTATYVLSTNTWYTDNILELHVPPSGVSTPWTLDDTKDIGLRFHYYGSGADQNAALVMDNTTKYLTWYNTGAEGTSTFTGSSFGTFKTGNTILTGATSATSTTTGALTVAGGVGIGGALYIGSGNLLQATPSGIAVGTHGQIFDDGNLHIHSTTNGDFWLNNTAGNQLRINNQYSGNIIMTNGVGNVQIISTQSAISTATGALQIPYGGLGVGGALFVGNTATIISSVNATSTTTGALQVTGGVGVGGNIVSSGYGQFYGPYNESTTNTGTYIGYLNATPRMGFFNGTASQNWQIDNQSGNFRWYTPSTNRMQLDANGNLTVYAGTTATSTTSGSLVLSGGAGIGGALFVGNTATIISSVNASSTTTGALIVSGGAGIGGGLYVGGNIYFGPPGIQTALYNISGAGTISNNQSLSILTNNNGGGTKTYVFDTAGGLSIPGITNSTSTTTGALTVVGGVGIGGGIYVGNNSTFTGILSVNNSTGATSTTTGALQVRGGVAVGADVYVGGNIYANGTAQVLTTATGVWTLTAGTDTAVSTSTGQIIIWDVSTLQSVTGRGATTNNALTLSNSLTFASQSAVPLNLTSSYTSSLGLMINATGTMIPTSQNAYFMSAQHTIAPTTATMSTYYGLLFLPTLSNTSTYTQMFGNFSRLDMGAAATTGSYVASWYGYFSANPSKNAAAATTLSNYFSFYAQDPNQVTSTNVYGYYSSVANTAGSSKFAFYSAGTALNYFNGNVQFATTMTYVGNNPSGITSILTRGGADPNFQLATQNGPGSNGNGAEVARLGINYAGSGWDTYFQFSRGTGAQNGNIVLQSNTGPILTFNPPNTAATSTSTGTLIVYGGLGVGGALAVNNTATVFAGVNAASTNSGSLVVQGGAGIWQNLWVGGNLNVAGTVNATITGVTTTATNLAGGTTGQVPYQSNIGVTSFFGPGTAGQLLVSNGAAAPGYISTLSIAGNVVNITSTVQSNGTSTGALVLNGGIGVGGNVNINGALNAITKSFLIDHPTQPGKKLRYGSLEGPENGIYLRGRLTGSTTINLPDYWTKLVSPDSITVQLTPVGKHQKLYVESVDNTKVIVKNDSLFGGSIDCYYVIFAERADVEKLKVEF